MFTLYVLKYNIYHHSYFIYILSPQIHTKRSYTYTESCCVVCSRVDLVRYRSRTAESQAKTFSASVLLGKHSQLIPIVLQQLAI